jgi:hypothetical protein
LNASEQASFNHSRIGHYKAFKRGFSSTGF